MTEPDYDLDESYVYLSGEDGHVGEQRRITETLLLSEDGSEVSRKLLDLLLLTCGGAG